tara:strand:- start:39 stop:788 length:750 start_codon:yes stop_codon:yes gene_type:complete
MSFEKIKKIAANNQYEFVYKKKCKSTMLDLKKLYNIKKKNYIILSEEQTNGLGRRGNIWHSPKGNIYCSINFNGKIKIKNYFLFNILIATSIKKVLEKFKIDNILFKWPNDIFFKKQKFCGIISETYTNSKNETCIISGFGINIYNSPKINEYPTTFISSFYKEIEISFFLQEIFRILFLNLKKLFSGNDKKIIDYFNKNLMFLNKNVKINTENKKVITGKVLGINNRGSLMLKNNNKILNLYSGSIIL